MGGFILAWAALAALQEAADLPTVALPPQAEAVEPAPVPSAPVAAAESARRVVVPADPAPAPRRLGEGPSDLPSLGGFVAASVLVVGLLGGGLWALRRFGRGSRLLGGGGPIRVLGRKGVGARQEILLVEVGARVLVVGATRDGLSPLGEITNPDEVAALRADLPGRRDESERASFQATLKEGLAAPAPAPAAETQGVYASIAEELAEIRKTVHAWKA
jgi:flagellar biogenesis protein FliO